MKEKIATLTHRRYLRGVSTSGKVHKFFLEIHVGRKFTSLTVKLTTSDSKGKVKLKTLIFNCIKYISPLLIGMWSNNIKFEIFSS